jgi:cytochrome c oxidase assembly protein subunit 15
VATFFLIFVGGLVTSTGSSLAVPDWPLSFGQVFPPMVGGVFYEHGHRMVAGTVGMLMLTLAVWTWLEEPRAWVRWLAGAALGAVVLQAVLGGITVLLLLPTAVSVSHAGLAQLFFCLVVALALVTGKGWLAIQPAVPRPGTDVLRFLAPATTAAIYLQLLIGAVMRHTGSGLAIPDFPLAFGGIVPPLDSPAVAIHFAHRVGAAIVSALVISTVSAVFVRHRDRPELLRPAALLLPLLALQITLGAFTIWTQKAVFPTTAHVAIGAAVLGTSLVLALRSRLVLAPAAERAAVSSTAVARAERARA